MYYILPISLLYATAFATQFQDLNPLPYPDSHEVKKHCVLLPLQFKLDSHTLHARMEYYKICTALNRSMF